MPPVWRLDSAQAIDAVQRRTPLAWQDHTGTRHHVNAVEFGDVVLGRETARPPITSVPLLMMQIAISPWLYAAPIWHR